MLLWLFNWVGEKKLTSKGKFIGFEIKTIGKCWESQIVNNLKIWKYQNNHKADICGILFQQ